MIGSSNSFKMRWFTNSRFLPMYVIPFMSDVTPKCMK